MKKRRPGGDSLLKSLRVAVDAPQRMDGAELFEALPNGIADMAFIDPQYRGVLDHLAFGNEGARQRGRAALPQMTDDDIAFFLEEAQRVMRPSAHAVLWMDKFTLAEARWHRWVRRCRQLEAVDLLAWDKLTFGMGRRLRCCTEYAVILQKRPARAKGCWTDHAIRDCWPEMADGRAHPHAKPFQIVDRLIRAATRRDDLVVDPCAGSYVVLQACRRSGRHFVGCDVNG